MTYEEFNRRVREYREKHECGIFEAKEAIELVDRQERIAKLEKDIKAFWPDDARLTKILLDIADLLKLKSTL